MSYKARGVSDLLSPVRLPLAMAAMVGLLALTLLGPAMTMLVDTESGSGNVARQLGYTAVFLIIIVSMRPLKHPERLAVVPWPFWPALAWCWLSLTWALDPEVAVRRLTLTTIIIWSVFAVVRQLGVERSLLFIRGALIIALVANFVAVLAFPSVGITDAEHAADPLLVGKWCGIMAHKNVSGLVCALTILFFAFDRRKLPLVLTAIVILLSIIFLWFSDSKTSMGLVFIMAAAGFSFSKLKTRFEGRIKVSPLFRNLILVGLSMLLPLIHFGVQSDVFLNYVSDPSGLTGRTQIWSAMLRYYLNNPIFAAGYGSFWNIGTESPILTYGKGWVQTVDEGHNGFLELLVTIGLPGLVLVLVATLILPIYRLAKTRLTEATCAMLTGIVLFCLSHNFTETSLFDRDSIGQVFLMFTLAILWADQRQEPKRPLEKPDLEPRQVMNSSRPIALKKPISSSVRRRQR